MKKIGRKLLIDLVVCEQVVGSTFALLPQTRRSTRGASKQQTSNSTNDYSTSNKIVIPKNIITSNLMTGKTRGRKKKIRLVDSVDQDESYQNGQQFSIEDSINQRLSNKIETSSSDNKAMKLTRISLGSRRVNDTMENEEESNQNEDYQFNDDLEEEEQLNEEEDFEEEYYSQSNNSNSLNFKLMRQSQNGDSVNQYSEDYESNLGKKLTKRQKNIMMKNQVVTEELNDFEEPLMSLPEKKRKARKNKKVLTEEEQIKKLQMEEKRKQQFRKMNEEKRQQVVNQILNESGRQKIKRNKEELKKDMEKQAHKFRQLPESDIKIKFISNSQGESLAIDKKLAGVDILKPIDIHDEKIQYNIMAHAAALNNHNNGYCNGQNSYIYSPNVTQIRSSTNGRNGVTTNTTIYSNEQLAKKIEEQKTIMCSYCKKQQFKYKIPKTQLVACSLECFKLLKI